MLQFLDICNEIATFSVAAIGTFMLAALALRAIVWVFEELLVLFQIKLEFCEFLLAKARAKNQQED